MLVQRINQLTNTATGQDTSVEVVPNKAIDAVNALRVMDIAEFTVAISPAHGTAFLN